MLRWRLRICKVCGLDPQNLANSFLGFPRFSRRDSVAHIGWHDAMTGSGDLFRARVDQIINMKHELVQLPGKLDWAWLDSEIAPRRHV